MNYSINYVNIKDFPFGKYENDFNFIVNGKKYPTSRFVADILSPIIRKNHYNDVSNNEFIVDLQNNESPDYFSDFLRLATFQDIKLDSKRLDLYSEYFLQLGNINEYFYIENIRSNEANEKFSVQFIQKVSKIKLTQEFDIKNEVIQKHIKNISEHFSEIDKKELKKLSIEILSEIIQNENLKIRDEDELLDFLIEIYQEDRKYYPLFEYIVFLNVSEESLNKFVNSFEIDDLNGQIWHSICARLLPSFFTEKVRSSENYSEQKNVKNFTYEQGKEFNGIMQYLTSETGGNIHDNGTIEISSNSISGSSHPKNLVDYQNENFYDPYNSKSKDSFVLFDFKDKLVQLTGYSIKSHTDRFLKSWSLSVSNDGETWEEVDRHENDSILNKAKKVANFQISTKKDKYYRFIRLLETGYCWYCEERYDGMFENMEFFGKLQQPPTQ